MFRPLWEALYDCEYLDPDKPELEVDFFCAGYELAHPFRTASSMAKTLGDTNVECCGCEQHEKRVGARSQYHEFDPMNIRVLVSEKDHEEKPTDYWSIFKGKMQFWIEGKPEWPEPLPISLVSIDPARFRRKIEKYNEIHGKLYYSTFPSIKKRVRVCFCVDGVMWTAS